MTRCTRTEMLITTEQNFAKSVDNYENKLHCLAIICVCQTVVIRCVRIFWLSITKLLGRNLNLQGKWNKTALFPHTEPHTHHGKEKETHEWIFSWLSWLAVLLDGSTTVATESRNMAAKRQISETCSLEVVYHVSLWYWISMFCSINTCQFKVSADQHYVAISQAQVGSSSRSRVFLKLTANQVLGF